MGNSKNQDKKARQQQNQQQRSNTGKGASQAEREEDPKTSKPAAATEPDPGGAGSPGQAQQEPGSAPEQGQENDQAGMSAEDQERLKANMAPIGGASIAIPEGITAIEPEFDLYEDTRTGVRGTLNELIDLREKKRLADAQAELDAQKPADEAPKVQKVAAGEKIEVDKAKFFEMIYAMSSGHADRYNSQSLPTHLAQLVGLPDRQAALEYIRQARLQHAHRND